MNENIESAISQTLDNFLEGIIINDQWESNVPWTNGLKVKLTELGKLLNYDVATSAKGNIANAGEWLYDLCWYEENNNSKGFVSLSFVKLAAEIEWSVNFWDIQYDFEKLLAARAEFKLMIYQAKDWITVDEYCQKLVAMIDLFNRGLPDAPYLLVGWSNREKTFYSYRVAANQIENLNPIKAAI